MVGAQWSLSAGKLAECVATGESKTTAACWWEARERERVAPNERYGGVLQPQQPLKALWPEVPVQRRPHNGVAFEAARSGTHSLGG